MLYIIMNRLLQYGSHEFKTLYNMRRTWRESKVSAPTTWCADWDLLWCSCLYHHTLNLSPCCILNIVVTTHWNSTRSLLTSAKLSVGYLVVGITRELDKEPSLHCSSIYINTMWSMLQQCIYLMSYYSSTMLLPQGHHAMFMCSDVILFNLCHHVYTICIPWGTHVPWCYP